MLRRNPNAIHIGLTATPRKLEESKNASAEDQDITANNRKYFGEPVYEYTLIEAQEDGYLAACEIVKRKASIDNATLPRKKSSRPVSRTSRPACRLLPKRICAIYRKTVAAIRPT